MGPFVVGQLAPQVVGAAQSGRFYSLDHQAGRPAALVTIQGETLSVRLLDELEMAREDLLNQGVDLVTLASVSALLGRPIGGRAGEELIYLAHSFGLEEMAPEAPASVMIIDRGGRIVHLAPVSNAADLKAACAVAAPRLGSEPAVISATAAPVLIVPNLLTPDQCQALIDHFEASASRPGVIAAAKDGQAYAKLDEDKKRRREMELEPGSDVHTAVLTVIAQQCVPEIKKAFQADIAHADRILLARYDDDGGYFKRHRDNAAPQTAFREFAISLNLNTHAYEGGQLLFPEFDDRRYNPPAGGALIFSASLLHEAAPVTRGSRYVALSFLCTAAGAQRATG